MHREWENKALNDCSATMVRFRAIEVQLISKLQGRSQLFHIVMYWLPLFHQVVNVKYYVAIRVMRLHLMQLKSVAMLMGISRYMQL